MGPVAASHVPLLVKIGVRSWKARRVPVGRRLARFAVPVRVWDIARCEKEGGRWRSGAAGLFAVSGCCSSWWWSFLMLLLLVVDASGVGAAALEVVVDDGAIADVDGCSGCLVADVVLALRVAVEEDIIIFLLDFESCVLYYINL